MRGLAAAEGDAALLSAVRGVRDAAVGDARAKSALSGLGACALSLSLLSRGAVAAEAAAVVCALARGPPAVRERLLAADPVAPLLAALRAAPADRRLAEACLRALRAVVCGGGPEGPLAEARARARSECGSLAALLAPPARPRVASLVAAIVGAVCVDRPAQDELARLGVVAPLVGLLVAGSPDKAPGDAPELRGQLHAAVLLALAALTRDNASVGRLIAGLEDDPMDPGHGHGDAPVRMVFRLLRDRRPGTRLLAAVCIINLFRTGCLPSVFVPYVSLSVLPALVKLLSEPPSPDDGAIFSSAPSGALGTPADGPENELHLRTCAAICYLLQDSDELQKRAAELEAVPRLAQLLQTAASRASDASGGDDGRRPDPHDDLLEAILLALAAVSSLREESRKQIIDAHLLPRIVRYLDHPDPRIQAAACKCTMSLSRSVKNLRTSLVDAGIAGPLFKLLESGDPAAQVTASATICNIVLDFSPMKKTVLESGVIPLLVRMSQSSDPSLRLNATWAIKNLIYRATSELKTSVMKELTWEGLQRLLEDGEISVVEQAVNVLRNLACGKESDIEDAFNGLGETLFGILETKLRPLPGLASDSATASMHANGRTGGHPDSTGSSSPDRTLPSDAKEGAVVADDVILQALYVVANMATGSAAHKQAIMRQGSILEAVHGYLCHPRQAIRGAATWVVHNLTWPEDPGSGERIADLRRMGFEEQLRRMADSDSEEVSRVLNVFRTAAAADGYPN
ncbi:armadillo-type protein [Hyaloraphidium curvatum]|nr:armadillo-type protein [Hyaloraphidium curvatum]